MVILPVDSACSEVVLPVSLHACFNLRCTVHLTQALKPDHLTWSLASNPESQIHFLAGCWDEFSRLLWAHFPCPHEVLPPLKMK